MTFTATYVIGTNIRVMMRGKPPKKPATMLIDVWHVNVQDVKSTHSARLLRSNYSEAIDAAKKMLDGIIAEEGDTVRSAGLTISSH